MADTAEQRVYRIAKWSEVFETADSRRHAQLHWISIPLEFESNGFMLLVETFGDRAPAIYGAWIAMAKVAAKCPYRGVLMTERGGPITASRLAFMTRFPSDVFDDLISWASSQGVGWLEVITTEEANRLVTSRQSIANQSPNELQDKTRQDLTRPNLTQPAAAKGGGSANEILSVEDVDLCDVADQANKLLRCARIAKAVDAGDVWQIAFTAVRIGNAGLCRDLVDRVEGGKVNRTANYVFGAIRSACDDIGLDWKHERTLVPPAPNRKGVVTK